LPVRKGNLSCPSHLIATGVHPSPVDTGCLDLLLKEKCGAELEAILNFMQLLLLGIGGVHTPLRHKAMLLHQYLLKLTHGRQTYMTSSLCVSLCGVFKKLFAQM